jgi:hypothetical protein
MKASPRLFTDFTLQVVTDKFSEKSATRIIHELTTNREGREKKKS